MFKKLVAALSLGLVLFCPSLVSAAGLSLNPKITAYTQSCVYSADVELNTQGSLTDGTDLILLYDPSKINVLSLDNGSIYPSYVGKSIDNSTGKLTLSGLASLNQPVNGQGNFATINFQVKPDAPLGDTSLKIDFDPSNPNKTTDSNVVESGTIKEILNNVKDLLFPVSANASLTTPSASSTPQPTITPAPSSTPTPTSVPAAASFVKVDTSTSGSWTSLYGKDGYNIVGSSSSYPTYALVNVRNQSFWSWADSTNDPRALLKADSASRIAAAWYSVSSFYIDLNLTDGYTHQVSLYSLDYQNQGRAQKIQVYSKDTNQLLASKSISNFSNGQYTVWNLKGNVYFKITKTAGPNAVVSGLFLF